MCSFFIKCEFLLNIIILKTINTEFALMFFWIYMIRKGNIKSIDITTGMDVIEDENLQDIEFTIEGHFDEPELGEEVNFNIVLTTEGLRAVEITQALQNI